MTKTDQTKPGCMRYALSILGDKWTGLLVRELCSGPKTFSELEQLSGGISPRTLSQRLEKLQAEGIIETDEYCVKPRRCNYCLTSKGVELKGILDAMADWSAKHNCC